MSDTRPIGVFDSGVGGLTVVRALMNQLPDEPMVYIGDTARFPYGPKTVEEIRRYGIQIADELIRRNVKMLVVACNSVEVSAIDHIAARHGVPVIGVVEPGARAAVNVTRSGRIGMIGTEATVRSRAYERAVAAAATGGADVDIRLTSAACPSFVDHVETGDTGSDGLRRSARLYLEPLMEADIDTLILGCTHYPLLSQLLEDELGTDVVLVSSAEETANDVASLLGARGLAADAGPAHHRFFTTGDAATFDGLAAMFLGSDLATVSAEHLALPEAAWN
ncbi:MAG: glutamate racemase [Actinomycetota bacterium]|jgi:glutamate racemase|nr:glutamate racemase [Actinomycetota bacterium]